MSDFFPVRKGTVDFVENELNFGRGRILLSEPGFKSYDGEIVDVHLVLLDHPFIKNNFLYTERGTKKIDGTDWQTGWEKDRDYLLRPIPEKCQDPVLDSCRFLFGSLKLDSYEFKIGFQTIAGLRPIWNKNRLALYIPKYEKFEYAFRFALRYFILKMRNAGGFLSEETVINRIVDYAERDLETGDVFSKNVSAGLIADEFLDPAKKN